MEERKKRRYRTQGADYHVRWVYRRVVTVGFRTTAAANPGSEKRRGRGEGTGAENGELWREQVRREAAEGGVGGGVVVFDAGCIHEAGAFVFMGHILFIDNKYILFI